MIRIPTERPPTHPGDMLLNEFLIPLRLSPSQLAEATRLPPEFIDGLIQGTDALTPRAGLRLARYFGLSADFWMNLQLRWDLFHAQREEAEVLQAIRPREAVHV